MELLPVIFKVISNLGTRTKYDEVVDEYENSEAVRATQSISLGNTKSSMRRESDLEADKDRIQKQQALILKINASVAEHQQDVVEEALARWSEHAKHVSNDRLDEWADAMQGAYTPHQPPVYGTSGGFADFEDDGRGGAPTTTYSRTINGLRHPDDI